MIRRGLDTYIERQAIDEVRFAAQRTIARAEWRIGQSIAALEKIGAGGLRTCADIDLDALRRAVVTVTPIKEIAVVDATGTPRCLPSTFGAPTRMLSRELATADDRVFVTVIRPLEHGDRALRLTCRRAGDPLRLVAHSPSDVFLPDGAANVAASNPVVRIMLQEGTLIAARDATEERAYADGEAFSAQNPSTLYPMIVTATLSPAAEVAAP